jgi:prepilin-type N-terminal cleavage/methylation domain-containing protein
VSDSRGFTLVEILVAVAILSGAMLAIALMSLTSYERVQRSGNKTTAMTSAKQRIEWLRSQDFDSPNLLEGTTTEELTASQEGYVRITKIEDDTPTEGVKRLTVTIQTPKGRQLQLLSLLADK